MNDTHNRYFFIFLFLWTLVIVPSIAYAVDATFSWLPSQESTLKGYKIHYGTASRAYDQVVDVGNPGPSADGRVYGTVTGLTAGITYYFAATAYDTNDVESDYSREVIWPASPTSTNTEIFGDTPDSTQPGTLSDTWLDSDKNHAAEPQLILRSSSAAPPHKPAASILIKVDLSSLPANIRITKATLYLYQTVATGADTYTTTISRLSGITPLIHQATGYNAADNQPWTPVTTGTTTNDIPLAMADTAPPTQTIALDTQTGYRAWTITSMVQNWVQDPTANVGLLITGSETSTATDRIFAATENPTASIRPKLVVHYEQQLPKPSISSVQPIADERQ